MGKGSVTFGPFVLERDSGRLLRDGAAVPVGHRAMALLDALVEAEGAVVGKAELMEAGWPGTAVEEGNLTVQIAALRKALGARPDGQDWIVTVPRVGYRLPRADASLPMPETAGLPSLAVLPFQNLSNDPSQEYFADGIVDELITAFSRFRSFAVISRRSSFAQKGRQADVRLLASELGVRYVVEGSVRRGGDRLRIAAQLVDAADGANLWAQTFEGPLDDVFEFQDRITVGIAGLIEPQVRRAELARLQRERPNSLAAYDLYLRGVAKIYLFTPAANAEAIALLDRAVEIEPDNATFLGFLAWALEHRLTMNWPAIGADDRELCLRLANEALDKAPNDASVLAHCGLALTLLAGEHDRGLLVTRKAVELNPNDMVALINAGLAEFIGGELANAQVLLRRTLDINPGYEAMSGMASVHLALREYEECLTWASKAHALNRNYIPALWSLVAANAMSGKLEAAREALGELRRLVPDLTISKLNATGPTKDPARDAPLIEGMRLAGLPE